jgi:hypothetical protein
VVADLVIIREEASLSSAPAMTRNVSAISFSVQTTDSISVMVHAKIAQRTFPLPRSTVRAQVTLRNLVLRPAGLAWLAAKGIWLHFSS